MAFTPDLFPSYPSQLLSYVKSESAYEYSSFQRVKLFLIAYLIMGVKTNSHFSSHSNLKVNSNLVELV